MDNQELPPQEGDKPLTCGRISLQRSPRAFSTALPKKTSRQKRVLGIDLGTNCGVAICDCVGPQPWPLYLGQWDLSLTHFESGPLRFIRLEQFLDVAKPNLIVYEDVKFTPGGDQFKIGKINIMAVVARVATASELLGGFKVILTRWAEANGVPAAGVGIGMIKKYATGKGNANKVDVITAANKKFSLKLDIEGYENTGVDNMADAAFACALGMENYDEWLLRPAEEDADG